MKFKNIALFIGAIWLITWAIVAVLTFIYAWFNGGVVSVPINNFGEAPIEMVFLAVGFPFGVYASYKLFDQIGKKRK